jgi:outer membrane protein
VAEEESMGRYTSVALAMVGPLWWAMSSMTLGAEPVKVAVMDQQLVIERSKAGKRALEDLKAYQATRQKIINSDDQELKELEQTIQDAKLSEAAKQEKQNQFQGKLEAYQRRLADFNREIQQKQREMVGEYTKKVQEAAQVVAQREGYIAVIDRGNEALIRIVIYYQRGLDVTDQVVKEFDKLNK